ncbi:uncharacterized protein LOC142174405 [Nicotiana tabacum]|uniref:Uncharacterized protein LOC142174405 n=1 Tax=Nicotiana tabacum TaxID=4097 RepID=A0AC58TGE2_TOBAC
MTELVGSYTASIQKLEMQMRDLSREQNSKQKGTLPSDTITNPKGSESGRTSHVMEITTRSGKVLQGEGEQVVEVEEFKKGVKVEEPSVVEIEKISKDVQVKKENWEEVKEKVKETPKTLPPIPRPPPLFPQRLAKKVDDSKLEKFYDILKQLLVNIAFVEAFQEMPGFAKYLKDLITKKKTTKNEVKEDPGDFNIPCTIGLHTFARALCDNEASINLMPLTIYKKAGLGMPRPTSMRLQMADRSIKRLVGIVDDVLVKVEKFHLPTDFVILDCAVDKEIPIILGRPFLATGRALMDSERNEIKFCVNDEEVTFQARNGMKLPHEHESISVIDVVDEVEDAVEMKMEEQCLSEALSAILVNFDGEDMEGYIESVNALERLGSYTYAPAKLSLDLENRATPPAKPSIIEPPQLELKSLPPHLRHKFLGSNDTLPVIISSLLNDVQVEQLLEVLKEHRQAIVWTITDIRGIPAGICEHKIQLEALEDQEKTAFTCPYGTFAFSRMPFGLCNAPTTFQRCMISIFSDMVEDFVEVFMDDFSVVGNSFEHCLNNLRQVLKRCEETNLVLNWEKCYFMVDEGIVLGHIISKRGIEVDRGKIEIISKLPPPTSVKGVRSFLGHAGFYRRFIKDFSKIANPMCKLLEKDAKFVFDEKCLKAFEELKQRLTTTPIIVPPDWSLPFELICDTSGVAVGGNAWPTSQQGSPPGLLCKQDTQWGANETHSN